MRLPIRSIVVITVAFLALTACGKKAPEPAPVAALARPVLAVEAQAGRVSVPQAVLVERGGVPGVFVLTDASQARFRMVRTGKRVNDRVEILGGLRGNETLVAGDLHAVFDGSPIRQ